MSWHGACALVVAAVSAAAHATAASAPAPPTTVAEPALQASPLPTAPIDSPEYAKALLALRDSLRRPAPPVTEREEKECLSWMRAANPAITRTLVGHHVIVACTDEFAANAARSEFVLKTDMGFEVLRHLWGTDPTARVGRRFVIWADPDKPGGHSCNGRELRIHVGRSDWSNADWFERYFHEMTHGFQFEHPACCYMVNGFFEGWAEFMQAAVADHLAPLGGGFETRGDWYGEHFPASAQFEYLQTRLPIEEIVAYDPSAGFMMELVNTTKQPGKHRDWTQIRHLLQDPLATPHWVPWHLWPALLANACIDNWGPVKARPILAKYRFPVDDESLRAARDQDTRVPTPCTTKRAFITEWKTLGPFPNPNNMGMEWDPACAEQLAWSEGLGDRSWSPIAADASGIVHLPAAQGSEFHYLVGALPADLCNGGQDGRGAELTLYISSDDECAVWLDTELVHYFRGERSCTPDYPDVAYVAVRGGSAGSRSNLLTVLVLNHGGPAAFSLGYARGGTAFTGLWKAMASADPDDRAAAVSYAASRRNAQPMRHILEQGQRDRSGQVQCAVHWWPDLRPANDGGDYAEAEDAYFRGTIRGGYYWNNAGSSGNQCVARNWGGDKNNYLSLPLTCNADGPARVRIRYACPNTAALQVRVRRGDQIIFDSPVQSLKPSGKDWTAWAWHDVEVPALARGRYHVELLYPSGSPDIDIIGLVPRSTTAQSPPPVGAKPPATPPPASP